MTDLVITLPDDTFLKLREVATNYRLTPEQLVFVSSKDLLEQPDSEFPRATDYFLAKNAGLYRRLA